ncbi:MAG: 23S rRNA (pseudouridine(1915)-N(3))-methyltransferase RlmH [Candidatus Zixiibacteriota bacterium]
MKILFVAVGSPRAQWAKGALEHYQRFLAKYATCEWRFVRAAPSSASNAVEIRRIEAERILEVVANADGFKVACDSTGHALETDAFARLWQKSTDTRRGRAVVVVGGAWGLDAKVRQWADWVWSFGPLTLPHEVALIVAAEQIARALSILRGDSYHK